MPTRGGNGTEGQDVTHQAIKLGFPHSINSSSPVYVRAEALVPKKIFNKQYLSDTTPNARNFIAGLFNRKTPIPSDVAKNIRVVAYSILSHMHNSKSNQLNQLDDWGFEIPENSVELPAKHPKLEDKLIQRIKEYQQNGDYESDGQVIDVDDPSKVRQLGNETNSINPKYARGVQNTRCCQQRTSQGYRHYHPSIAR